MVSYDRRHLSGKWPDAGLVKPPDPVEELDLFLPAPAQDVRGGPLDERAPLPSLSSRSASAYVMVRWDSRRTSGRSYRS